LLKCCVTLSCCLPWYSVPTGSSISTPDLSSATEGAKDAASDLKSKAQSALSGLSAVPNSIATLADQNADVRGLSANYRDPAGAIQQDKAKGERACCFSQIVAWLYTHVCRAMGVHPYTSMPVMSGSLFCVCVCVVKVVGSQGRW